MKYLPGKMLMTKTMTVTAKRREQKLANRMGVLKTAKKPKSRQSEA